MKPRDILQGYIEKYLVSPLCSLGFSYSTSKLCFSRKDGDFKLEFSFSLSKWNSEDDCTFWTGWCVSSKYYSKWHENEWGTKPRNDIVIGYADWNISGWTRDVMKHFCLKNMEKDEEEFKTLQYNIFNVGIPFFAPIKSWDIAAEYALNGLIVFYDKVCDFYLLSGQKGKAKGALNLGIKEIKKRGHDQFRILPELEKRMDRYFSMNDPPNFV